MSFFDPPSNVFRTPVLTIRSIIFLGYVDPARFLKMLHPPSFNEKIHRWLPVKRAEDPEIVSFGIVRQTFNVFYLIEGLNRVLIGGDCFFVFLTGFGRDDDGGKPGAQNGKIPQKACHPAIAVEERVDRHEIQMKIGVGLRGGLHVLRLAIGRIEADEPLTHQFRDVFRIRKLSPMLFPVAPDVIRKIGLVLPPSDRLEDIRNPLRQHHPMEGKNIFFLQCVGIEETIDELDAFGVPLNFLMVAQWLP